LSVEKGKRRERKEKGKEKRGKRNVKLALSKKILAMALISTCFIYKPLELQTAS